jgi:flavin reductase (DIM6/NTAB) family NADH-FMN oxidoreductase RutF
VKEMHDMANDSGKVTTTIVIAEVVCFHIREDLYHDNHGKVVSLNVPQTFSKGFLNVL